MPTEIELIAQVLEGDKTAFTALLEPHRVQMYRLVFSYCRNAEDTEDVLQEVIVRVYRALPKFQGKSKLSTWLYRICVNTSLTFIKKRKRNFTSDIADLPLVDTRLKKPEDAAVECEQRKRLRWAIERLSARQKAVVMLRVQDLPYAQIAVQLGITVNNAKVHYSNAVKRLKAVFGDAYEK